MGKTGKTENPKSLPAPLHVQQGGTSSSLKVPHYKEAMEAI